MAQVKQRGSAWSIKLVFNLYKLFGYKFIYYLMYPVSFFYFIFASNVKDSLKIYYKQLDITFTNKIYFEHLRMFANCMVDRFISKYDPDSYNFINKELELHKEVLDKKSILLFSHFGGWASTSNKPITDNMVNIVMQEILLNGIKEIEQSIEKKVETTRIIDLSLGAISVSINIANAISNDEVIAMMADRPTDKKYIHKTDFLKGKGNFNKNPFQIAYRTKTPILALFAIHKEMQSYEVKALKLDIDYNLSQDEAIDKALREYANLFENILKKYPNQWLNFYNFWE
jgi:predicted LPLAT superfamily acyltransferase